MLAWRRQSPGQQSPQRFGLGVAAALLASLLLSAAVVVAFPNTGNASPAVPFLRNGAFPALGSGLSGGVWAASGAMALLHTALLVTVLRMRARVQSEYSALVAEKRRLDEDRTLSSEIVSIAQQGLFRLDPDGRIHPGYSPALDRLLGACNLGGVHLVELLRPHLPESKLATIEEYLELLFKPSIQERTVERVNPMLDLEIPAGAAAPERQGVRYLSFTFERGPAGRGIEHVMGRVTDVTESVRLGQRLEASEKQAQARQELAVTLLRLGAGPMQTFVERTERRCGEMQLALRGGPRQATWGRLALPLSSLANEIKTDAELLGIRVFTDAALRLTHRFDELLSSTRFEEGGFRALLTEVEQLQRLCDDARELLEQTSGVDLLR